MEDSIGLGFVTDTIAGGSGKNDLSQYVDSSLESIGRITQAPHTDVADGTDDREGAEQFGADRGDTRGCRGVCSLGSTRLNDAGPAQTNYDVWDIRDGAWTLAGTYFSASDTIALEGAMMDDAMKDDEMIHG